MLFTSFVLMAQVNQSNLEFPDVEAQFPGGNEAMAKFIQDSVIYPELSRELGDQGRVYVSFIVEIDGSISNIDVPRSLTLELDREAKRIVSIMPRWSPALVKESPVRSMCRLPITFTLTEPEKKKGIFKRN